MEDSIQAQYVYLYYFNSEDGQIWEQLIRLRSSISNCETLKTYLETVLVHPLQMTMPELGEWTRWS